MPPKRRNGGSAAQNKFPEGYGCGDLVLARFPGYPKWPAIVIPLPYLTKKVLRQRKPGKLCVGFFGDATFFWSGAEDLERFENKEELIKRIKSVKELTEAVSELKKFVSLEQYIRDHGLIGDDEEFIDYKTISGEDETEVDEEKEKEKAHKPLKHKIKDDEEEEDYEEEDVQNRRKKSARGDKKIKVEADQQDVVKDEKEKDRIKKEYETKCLQFRSKLQRGLIQRKTEPTEEELKTASDYLKQLEEFSSKITIDLLRISKLQKVLRAILKIPGLERPEDFKFHDRSSRLLVEWNDIITELRNEKALKNGNNSSILQDATTTTVNTNAAGEDEKGVKVDQEEIDKALTETNK